MMVVGIRGVFRRQSEASLGCGRGRRDSDGALAFGGIVIERDLEAVDDVHGLCGVGGHRGHERGA